jgi:hypothetical protein
MTLHLLDLRPFVIFGFFVDLRVLRVSTLEHESRSVGGIQGTLVFASRRLGAGTQHVFDFSS